jgi:hypothetical protein
MMQFGPGTPYPTAMHAVAASVAHRDRWVAKYPSMQQDDDARLVQSIRDIPFQF